MKKAKKAAFKKAKEVLPEKAVLDIQKKRLEGGITASHKPNSYEGTHTYSIVSAVYNVEKYLDYFFQSVTTQTISSNKLKLIMVDDGSTDGSARIIQKWKQEFPELIEYFHKENDGQASARNVGLEHVDSDWVTFIDPDDFVSENYFEEVDKVLSASSNICFVTCRYVFYDEAKGEYFDKHPLREEFKNNVSLFNAGDDFMPISLATNKSFFEMKEIEKKAFRFCEEIKPDFEDAHFLNTYLISLNRGRIAYLRKPVYYYRKREDGSSTLDSSWKTPDKFSTVLEKGKIDLLKTAKQKLGYVPFYIQKVVLYDLQWYFKQLVGREERTQHFQDLGLKDIFWKDIQEIFSYIDAEVIEKMPGGWLNYEKKIRLYEHV